MDTTTSEMVERLYASGKVERASDRSTFFLYWVPGSGSWRWKRSDSDWYAGAATDDIAESVIGWSLVQACWAKRMVPRPWGDGFRVDIDDATPAVMNDDSIRAMAEALGGGE